MKYGESAFDILYLIFVITIGILILRRARNRTARLMGAAALILGFGDAFHLIPRVLNYFVDDDFSVALGIGKLITSITMTVFLCFCMKSGRGIIRSVAPGTCRLHSGCCWPCGLSCACFRRTAGWRTARIRPGGSCGTFPS